MSTKSLGNRIKEYRSLRGYTQSQMAEKLGMQPANFSSYERDKSVPPSNVLSKIADILNVSSDYLLGKSEDPEYWSKDDEDSLEPLDIEEALEEINKKYEEIKKQRQKEARDRKDLKKFLEQSDIMFDGVPMTDEEKARIQGFMESMFWDAKEKNRRKPKNS